MQIEQLNVLAKERGQTLAEMALAWVLKDGVVTSVLIGASKPSQILDDIRAIQNLSLIHIYGFGKCKWLPIMNIVNL